MVQQVKKLEDGNIVQLNYVITNKTAALMVHQVLHHLVQLMVLLVSQLQQFQMQLVVENQKLFHQ